MPKYLVRRWFDVGELNRVWACDITYLRTGQGSLFLRVVRDGCSRRVIALTRQGLARAAQDGPQIMNWKVKIRGTPYPTRWNNVRPGTYGLYYFDRAAGALQAGSSR
jgi:hypothetical protein